jgi:hypothetical protein
MAVKPKIIILASGKAGQGECGVFIGHRCNPKPIVDTPIHPEARERGE